MTYTSTFPSEPGKLPITAEESVTPVSDRAHGDYDVEMEVLSGRAY
jgi:hypothetical protein